LRDERFCCLQVFHDDQAAGGGGQGKAWLASPDEYGPVEQGQRNVLAGDYRVDCAGNAELG